MYSHNEVTKEITAIRQAKLEALRSLARVTEMAKCPKQVVRENKLAINIS